MGLISAEQLQLPPGALVAVIVLAVVELALAVFCIVDLIRRPAVLGDRKWLWVLLIVLFTLPGSIIYLAIGRVPAPAPEVAEDGGDTLPRAAAAATALYAAPGQVQARAPAAPPAAPSPLAPAAVDPPLPRTPSRPSSSSRRRCSPAARPPSPSPGSSRSTRPPRRWTASTSSCPRGRSSASLAPTAPARPPRCASSPGWPRPTSGSARIFGQDTTEDADAVHAMIGYLPDVPGFYKWMTAREYLELSAGLFGLPTGVRDERIGTLLELAGLSGVSTKVGGYSRGMKQRLGVAQALINSPRPAAARRADQRARPDRAPRGPGDDRGARRPHHRLLLDAHPRRRRARLRHGGGARRRPIVEQAATDELRSRHGGAQRVVIEASDPQALASALAGEAWAGAVHREGRELLVEVADLELAYREVPALVAPPRPLAAALSNTLNGAPKKKKRDYPVTNCSLGSPWRQSHLGGC